MEIAFSLILSLYLIFLIVVIWWWSKLPRQQAVDLGPDCPGVSIVVPARNEEHNIDRLLCSMTYLKYPKQKLELIVVDDASEDGTLAKLQHQASLHSNLVCVIIEKSDGFQGSFKKRALTRGIEAAKFPIVVTTDADCQFHPHWIRSLVSAIHFNQWEMTTGPVVYGDGHLSSLLNIELSCLVAVGAVFLRMGHPNMCNGANLAFSRRAFFEVDGYRGFEQVVSGDDEFLLYKMSKRYPERVGFLKSREAVVVTDPPKSWKELLDQRKRWGSKWKSHKSGSPKLMAVFIFCFHLFFTVVLLMTLGGFYSWKLFAGQLMAKMIMEVILVTSVLSFLGKRLILKWFILMQVLYSFYVVFVGLGAQFGGFQWKNRKY